MMGSAGLERPNSKSIVCYGRKLAAKERYVSISSPVELYIITASETAKWETIKVIYNCLIMGGVEAPY